MTQKWSLNDLKMTYGGMDRWTSKTIQINRKIHIFGFFIILMKNFKTLILLTIMIACSVNGHGHVRCPLDPPNSTVISNRCLNNNLREMIKFHFLKLLPKVRIWNFNQNTFTTFHQNSYRIVNCTIQMFLYDQGSTVPRLGVRLVQIGSKYVSFSKNEDQFLVRCPVEGHP